MLKHRVSLVGIDGNAFNIMGYVVDNMRQAHFSQEERNAYIKEATNNNYDNLIQVSLKYCDLINNRVDKYVEEY